MHRVVLLICACWLIGCGPKGPATGSVQGTVTHNGQALTVGTVTLMNPETGIGGSAELDATGSFHIESLRTGTYRVAIQPPAAPSPEETAAGATVEPLDIPAKYQSPDTSELTATVNVGNNTVDLDLK